MGTAAEVAMRGAIAVHDSSGNVFEDLGLPDPEERLAKAELVRAIRAAIGSRAAPKWKRRNCWESHHPTSRT
jgi:hypothetical protein